MSGLRFVVRGNFECGCRQFTSPEIGEKFLPPPPEWFLPLASFDCTGAQLFEACVYLISIALAGNLFCQKLVRNFYRHHLSGFLIALARKSLLYLKLVYLISIANRGVSCSLKAKHLWQSFERMLSVFTLTS